MKKRKTWIQKLCITLPGIVLVFTTWCICVSGACRWFFFSLCASTGAMIYFRYSLPAWPQLNQILCVFSARMCTERLSTAAAAEDRIKKIWKERKKNVRCICVMRGNGFLFLRWFAVFCSCFWSTTCALVEFAHLICNIALMWCSCSLRATLIQFIRKIKRNVNEYRRI